VPLRAGQAKLRGRVFSAFDRATMRRLLFHGTAAVEPTTRPIVDGMVCGFKLLLSGTANKAYCGDGTATLPGTPATATATRERSRVDSSRCSWSTWWLA